MRRRAHPLTLYVGRGRGTGGTGDGASAARRLILIYEHRSRWKNTIAIELRLQDVWYRASRRQPPHRTILPLTQYWEYVIHFTQRHIIETLL